MNLRKLAFFTIILSICFPAEGFQERAPKKAVTPAAFAIYGYDAVLVRPKIEYVGGDGIYLAPGSTASIIAPDISNVARDAIHVGSADHTRTIPFNLTGYDWITMSAHDRDHFLWAMNEACEKRGIYLRRSISVYYHYINDAIIDNRDVGTYNLLRLFEYAMKTLEPEIVETVETLDELYSNSGLSRPF